MSLLRIIIISSLGFLTFVSALEAHMRVMPAKRRGVVLQEVEHLIDRLPKTLDETIFNPFVTEVDEPVPVVVTKEPVAISTLKPVQKKTFDGQTFLKGVSEQIAPNGTIERNGSYILLIGRNIVNQGDPITVTYEGKDFDIIVDSIKANQYTLRYKEHTIIQLIN